MSDDFHHFFDLIILYSVFIGNMTWRGKSVNAPSGTNKCAYTYCFSFSLCSSIAFLFHIHGVIFLQFQKELPYHTLRLPIEVPAAVYPNLLPQFFLLSHTCIVTSYFYSVAYSSLEALLSFLLLIRTLYSLPDPIKVNQCRGH